jgi:hypothetical protein
MIAAVMMLVPGGFAAAENSPTIAPVDAQQIGDWSKIQDGLTVRMVADRTVYHAGEQMRLQAEARNSGDGKLYVPTGGEMHLLTPSGEHMVYAYSSSNRANLSPGSTVMLGYWWNLRLVKGSTSWRPADGPEGKNMPADLSRVGTYTFWHEHEAKPGWLATMDKQAAEKGEPAWTGKSVTPRLKIEVRELGDADKVRELTASQRNDLRIVAEGPDKHDRRELEAANNRLAKDLLLAANVGLADAAAALVVEHVSKNADDPTASIASLHYALSRRAVEPRGGRHWPPVELAIRGDYLRPLAELELKLLKASFDVAPPQVEVAATQPLIRRARPGLSTDVLLSLCLDSKDDPLRKPLAELAAANAKLPDPLPWKRGQDPFDREDITLIRYYHPRLATAWGLLRALDVLQDKTEAEVIAILGQPTKRYENTLEWYAASEMHVNPFVRVVFVGGKAQSSVATDVVH